MLDEPGRIVAILVGHVAPAIIVQLCAGNQGCFSGIQDRSIGPFLWLRMAVSEAKRSNIAVKNGKQILVIERRGIAHGRSKGSIIVTPGVFLFREDRCSRMFW